MASGTIIMPPGRSNISLWVIAIGRPPRLIRQFVREVSVIDGQFNHKSANLFCFSQVRRYWEK